MPLFPSVLGPGTWRDGSGWPHREDSLTDVDSFIWVVLPCFFSLFILLIFFYFVNVRLWAFLEFCTGSLHLRSLMYVFTSAWIALNAATSFHLSFLLFILCNTTSSFFFTVSHMALFYSISQWLLLVNFFYIWFHFTLYIGLLYYIWFYYMQIICSFRTWGVEFAPADHSAVPVCASEHERYWHPTQPNPTPPHPNLSINLFVYLSVYLSVYQNLSQSI